MNMALNKYSSLVLWIGLYVSVSWVIGRVTLDDVQTWYPNLLKPPLNPPDLAFPIVWTTLYVMMAITGWMIWQRRPHLKSVALLFAIQTMLNWAWSFVFFEFHLLGAAFAWIAVMVVLTAILICKLWSPLRTAAILLLPYLLWISFASYLSGSIWILN